jgi:hypothetical protein
MNTGSPWMEAQRDEATDFTAHLFSATLAEPLGAIADSQVVVSSSGFESAGAGELPVCSVCSSSVGTWG